MAHRFDLHAAFAKRPMLGNFPTLSRPRLGCFVQAAICAEKNGSRTNIIPTFTANFLASSLEDAENITKLVAEQCDSSLLRIRCEYQLPAMKYEKTLQQLRLINEQTSVAPFAHVAQNSEYFDCHIHLDGVNTAWKYQTAGEMIGLPMITNVGKPKHTPFVTQRWYNCTYEEVLKSVCSLYQRVHGPLEAIGVQMRCIPEMEWTHYDPDCQVTDAGWMPTPSTPFVVGAPHFVPPVQIKFEELAI